MKKKQKQCEKKKDKSLLPFFPQKLTWSVTLVRSLNIEKGFEEFEIIFRGEYVQNISKKPKNFRKLQIWSLFCSKSKCSVGYIAIFYSAKKIGLRCKRLYNMLSYKCGFYILVDFFLKYFQDFNIFCIPK